MPFTFKLSQRLARMKLPLAIAAAAFAACELPVRVTDPTPPNSPGPDATIRCVRSHAGRRQRRRRRELEYIGGNDYKRRSLHREQPRWQLSSDGHGSSLG